MKKILAMLLSVAIIATIAISGTIAYLSDQDAAVNQATVGTVFVKQYEKLRVKNDDNTLMDFVNGEMIVPAVPAASPAPEADNVTTPGGNVSMSKDINNYHDKIVYAQNTGTSPAYMRTVIGVPAGSYQTWLHLDFNNNADWTIPEKGATPAEKDVAISGGLYDLYVLDYSEAVAKDSYTTANLLGFYVDKDVNNVKGEDGKLSHYVYGDKNIGNISNLKILVATQAVQTEGFANAAAAFKATYGDVSATNHPWVGTVDVENAQLPDAKTDDGKTVYEIYTAEQLFAVAKAANKQNISFGDATIKLMADINLQNQKWEPIGQNLSGYGEFNGTFDGNNHTIYNLYIDSAAETDLDEDYSTGLFGYTLQAKIKNLTIDGAVVKGVKNTGVIVGYLQYNGSELKNCIVKNATVVGTCNADCGKNVGGIVGFVNSNCSVSDCKVENSSISGAYRVGQVIGTLQAGATSTDNTASDVTVSANAANCTDDEKDTHIGGVIGYDLRT